MNFTAAKAAGPLRSEDLVVDEIFDSFLCGTCAEFRHIGVFDDTLHIICGNVVRQLNTGLAGPDGRQHLLVFGIQDVAVDLFGDRLERDAVFEAVQKSRVKGLFQILDSRDGRSGLFCREAYGVLYAGVSSVGRGNDNGPREVDGRAAVGLENTFVKDLHEQLLNGRIALLEFIEKDNLIWIGFQAVERQFGMGVRTCVTSPGAYDSVYRSVGIVFGHVQNDRVAAGQFPGNDLRDFGFADAGRSDKQHRHRLVGGNEIQFVFSQFQDQVVQDGVLTLDALQGVTQFVDVQCFRLAVTSCQLDGGLADLSFGYGNLLDCLQSRQCRCLGRVFGQQAFLFLSVDDGVAEGAVQQRNGVVRTVTAGRFVFLGQFDNCLQDIVVQGNLIAVMLEERRLGSQQDLQGLTFGQFINDDLGETAVESRIVGQVAGQEATAQGDSPLACEDSGIG